MNRTKAENSTVASAEATKGPRGEPRPASEARSSIVQSIGPGKISMVYLYIAGFILFSLWIPNLWLSGVTHTSVLNISFAVPGMVAIAVMIALSAGAFDLSVAGSMTASAVTTAWLIAERDWEMWPAMSIGMLVALAVGVINGLLVVAVRVPSLIATLGMGAVLTAFGDWRSGGTQITGISGSFSQFSATRLWGDFRITILYVAVIAVVVWYLMEHMPAGRYLQATGDNPEAARLVGVRTKQYVFGSLMASAFIAGFAGIVQASTIGAAGSSLGDSFLLPSFAAVFLGATQFKGRFNVWGTLVAIWVLASGVQGVTLAVGSFTWLNNLFFGIALIVAVSSTSLLERYKARRAIRSRAALATKNFPPPEMTKSNEGMQNQSEKSDQNHGH